MEKRIPSMDAWLEEVKALSSAPGIGMYLIHNGTVRRTAKAKVRGGREDARNVTGMILSYDARKVDAAIEKTRKLAGIFCVKVWINEGYLNVGDDMMYVLVGGDIRPHVEAALQYLVGCIKNECITETELH